VALIETLLITTFTQTRRTRASDGQGGFTETWASVDTALTGRMRPASAAERTVADQNRAQISHVLYLLATETIYRGDRVTDGDRTWDVIAVREPSHSGHHLEVDCREVQVEGQP
jgi:SPP1 family predicted phage head-tail adaptor